MRRILIIALCSSLFCCINQLAYALSVNISLYNSYELIDLTNSSVLSGSTTEGYLVEILWTGPNQTIDPLNLSNFTPGGDDEILRDSNGMEIGVTHIGAGMPDGMTDGYVEIFLSDVDYSYYFSQGSTSLYVRFYNVADPQSLIAEGGDVSWGESERFEIPAPNVFYLADLDFAPTSTLMTSYMVSVPEPLSWILLLTALGAFIYARKRQNY